eukprot:1097293-Amphidinium_carterae.2
MATRLRDCHCGSLELRAPSFPNLHFVICRLQWAFTLIKTPKTTRTSRFTTKCIERNTMRRKERLGLTGREVAKVTRNHLLNLFLHVVVPKSHTKEMTRHERCTGEEEQVWHFN